MALVTSKTKFKAGAAFSRNAMNNRPVFWNRF